jgi:type VI secretion system protein VasG
MSLDLRSLIGKLDDTSRRALEGAAGLAVSRTHYTVEMEHWLAKLLEAVDSDIPRILRHFEMDPDRFLRELAGALGEYKTGNSRRPDLAENIEALARDAWVWCSVHFGLAKVRSGGILLAALSDPVQRRRLLEIHPGLKNVNVEVLEKDLLAIVGGSQEDREVHAELGATQRDADTSGRPGASRTPSLDQYTVDLTAEAKAGKIDPVLGRDHEIRQIVDILTRRRQNNPILTGEAGVGKTAVVEGFALRVAEGDVPEPLQNVAIKSLDLGLLQAGAGVKGEFENRLKQVIEEVKNSAQPIILFIDEAHTMIGAGGQAGQGDAANLLKPALARGELRTIAATTWAEYKKYFEKDPALTRRFQPVKVDEPIEDVAIRMMRGLAGKLEAHHGVRILDDAIQDSVRLSHRYIPGRQLPDKSVSVLDTACARVAIGKSSIPAPIEDLRRRLENLAVEQHTLTRESAAGIDHSERLAAIEDERREAQEELDALETRWDQEKDLVDAIQEIRTRLEEAGEEASGEDVEETSGEVAEPRGEADSEALRAELAGKKAGLAALQGDQPLVMVDVDGQTIAEVISAWTGIPMGKMVADEIRAVLGLVDTLKQRVIGQDHALEAISKRIHTSRASLDNPAKPVGVFLLVGPSGVGKTETALTLADALYGGERNAISINMSEYQEAHTVSSLKGSPPGYVGYGEGGVLTEAVRRKPYSVVLLDEVEKAHPDVMELFFQVFDKGVLEDGEGREIDFKNTVIILTSNIGTDTIMTLCADPETAPSPEGIIEAVRPELLKAFPAALLGRLVTIPFYPLAPDVMASIIRLQLSRIARRVRENHGAELVYGDDIVKTVQSRCTEAESGGRAIDNILTNTMLPQMSAEVLSRMAEGEPFSKIEVRVDDSGNFDFLVS